MADMMSCPAPFLDLASYPYTGGFEAGRFCGAFSSNVSCCLPCPIEYWSYSDSFERNVNVAYWFNVPSLVCQVLLLLTSAVLPKEKSHRHYLSIGLCLALILLELAFIVPLGTRPDKCYDAITPHDLHSDLSCGWSGALLEAGAMAGSMWILLRSLWTHLRVCYNVKPTSAYVWASHAIGWGVPGIFLGISLPITGVSYRLGPTCIPNQQNAFLTWFGWLIAFGCLAALIQCSTTCFCLWLYARHFWQGDNSVTHDVSTAGLTADGQRRPSVRLGKRMAWHRLKEVLVLQWRSILLSAFVIIDTVFFGAVYVATERAVMAEQQPTKQPDVIKFVTCLILSEGDRDACLGYAKVLGLNESTVIASLFMSALVGIFTFLLMVRKSMFVGWYELIWHPRRVRTEEPPAGRMNKRASGSVRFSDTSPFAKNGTRQGPRHSMRQMGVPEAGDVMKRHESTPANWFDDDFDEQELERGESRDDRTEDV